MKKIIFTITFFASSFFADKIIAQACPGGSGPSVCSPQGGPLNGGFDAPSTIPCAVQGVAYSYAIQFTMYDVFNYLGTQNVDSIRFNSIDNLPCGLCWAVDQADKTYAASEDGCISITGMTSDPAGQYKLGLGLQAWINHSTTPPGGLSIPAATVDQTGIRMVFRVKTSAGTCVSADTSSSANNLTASTSCPTGIREAVTDFSSLVPAPSPMNTNGVLSFTSEKSATYLVRIYDLTGKSISAQEVTAKRGNNSVVIERHNIPAGVYFLSLSDGKNTLTRRFTITE